MGDRDRGRLLSPADGIEAQLRHAILELLDARARGATICPSEAARQVGGERFRELMAPAREAARQLVEAGAIEVTQRGEVVDLGSARGPIRLRRRGP